MPSDATQRRAMHGRYLLHAMAAASVLGLFAGIFLGVMLWS